MQFRIVFTAVIIATALIVGALILNSRRPLVEVDQPTAQLVRASGKCAECHRQETGAIVHEYEMSVHAQKHVNCLQCHQPVEGQEVLDHRGFQIAKDLTAANCRQCHAAEYEQYLRSRHAAPSWAAVMGDKDFTPEQIAHSEQFNPGAVRRPPNDLVALEGPAAVTSGCAACHDIGKPNPDGTIGSCTQCHARHAASVALARTPETCGQCHMGPDHSQIEIFHESKHGVLFNAQKARMNLDAPPKQLTTADMPVPTCTTCHMSGLNGMKVTHDPGERLSYYLFAPVSEQRPDFPRKQAEMKALCLQCHTQPHVDAYYTRATDVLLATNDKVAQAKAIVDELRAEGLLTPEPFDEEIEFLYFDLWHYFGRTAKHGAFMGGADFVQWHGNYEILHHTVQLQRLAEELRAKKREQGHEPAAASPPSSSGGRKGPGEVAPSNHTPTSRNDAPGNDNPGAAIRPPPSAIPTEQSSATTTPAAEG